jgi:putative DNA primase/helicase
VTHPDLTTLDGMLAGLTAIGCQPRRSGSGWVLRCPHPDHHDDTPSASLTAGTRTPWVLHCHACSPRGAARGRWLSEVHARIAAGVPLPDAAPSRRSAGSGGGGGSGEAVARYDYVTADGALVARKTRWETPAGGKTFSWSRPVGDAMVTGLGRGLTLRTLPLYGLPSLRWRPRMPVWIVEGEKDVDRLHGMGLAAVSAAGGANRHPGAVVLPDDVEPLRGRNVIVVADHDLAGQGYAWAWRGALRGIAARLVLAHSPLTDPPGADISDHLDAGLDLYRDLVWGKEDRGAAR